MVIALRGQLVAAVVRAAGQGLLPRVGSVHPQLLVFTSLQVGRMCNKTSRATLSDYI